MELAFHVEDHRREAATAQVFVADGDEIERGDCVAVVGDRLLCRKCNQQNAEEIAEECEYIEDRTDVYTEEKGCGIKVVYAEASGDVTVVKWLDYLGILHIAGVLCDEYDDEDPENWAKENVQ